MPEAGREARRRNQRDVRAGHHLPVTPPGIDDAADRTVRPKVLPDPEDPVPDLRTAGPAGTGTTSPAAGAVLTAAEPLSSAGAGCTAAGTPPDVPRSSTVRAILTTGQVLVSARAPARSGATPEEKFSWAIRTNSSVESVSWNARNSRPMYSSESFASPAGEAGETSPSAEFAGSWSPGGWERSPVRARRARSRQSRG